MLTDLWCTSRTLAPWFKTNLPLKASSKFKSKQQAKERPLLLNSLTTAYKIGSCLDPQGTGGFSSSTPDLQRLLFFFWGGGWGSLLKGLLFVAGGGGSSPPEDYIALVHGTFAKNAPSYKPRGLIVAPIDKSNYDRTRRCEVRPNGLFAATHYDA